LFALNVKITPVSLRLPPPLQVGIYLSTTLKSFVNYFLGFMVKKEVAPCKGAGGSSRLGLLWLYKICKLVPTSFNPRQALPATPFASGNLLLLRFTVSSNIP
jgi:hypothetical protein